MQILDKNRKKIMRITYKVQKMGRRSKLVLLGSTSFSIRCTNSRRLIFRSSNNRSRKFRFNRKLVLFWSCIRDFGLREAPALWDNVYISHLPEADGMNATFLHLKVKPVGSLWGRTLDQIFTSGVQLANLEIPVSQYIKHHLNDLGQHLIPTVP
jgi:hypothetical protein